MEPAAKETNGGTVRPELLLVRVTAKPLLDAPFKPIVFPVVDVLLSVTVHIVEPLPAMDAGLQVIDETVGGGVAVSATFAACDVPLSVAVTIAVALTVPLLAAENCVEVDPAPTVTVAGTVNAALLLLSVTLAALVGAALNVIAHEVDPVPEIDAGLHASDVTVGGGVAVSATFAVCDVPLSVAVTIAVALTVPVLAAENCADVVPAPTVTVAGTLNAALLLLSVILAAFVGAALNVIVHEVDPIPEIDAGLHASDVTVGGGVAVSATFAVCDVPFSVAVTTAAALTVPLLAAENCADVDPAPTVTVAGTLNAELLLLSVTLAALVGAALNVIVHEVDPIPEIDAGLHASDVTVGGGVAVSATFAVCDVPFSVAVTTAAALTVPLLAAENCADVDPAPTVTVAGTVNAALLLLNPTVAPVAGAGLNVIVQLLDAVPTRDAGLHTKEDRNAAVAVKLTLAVIDEPPCVAVRTAAPLTDPLLVATNCALVAFWAIEMDCGTVNPALLLPRLTVVGALAASLSVTVHVLEPTPESAAGLQASETRGGAGVALRPRSTLCDVPFSEAVRVAIAFTAPLLVARNCAVVWPAATISAGGTVKAVLLLLKTTGLGTAAVSPNATVQLMDAAPQREVGRQSRDVTGGPAVSIRLVPWDEPFRLAVTPALPVTEPTTVAGNWTLLAPIGTLIDDGTITPGLLLLRTTAVAPTGALLNCIVQVLIPDPMKAAGPHDTPATVGGGGSRIRLVVCDVPFKLAVIVTVAFIEPLLDAVNWALVAFAGTLMDEGTVRAPLPLVSVTGTLLVDAALSVTVHVLAAGPASDPGLQTRLTTPGGTLLTGLYATVPPAPVTLTPLPPGEAAIGFATAILTVCVTVKLIPATTPSGIAVSFNPYATHV